MKKLLFTNHFSSIDPNSIFSNVQSPGEIQIFSFLNFIWCLINETSGMPFSATITFTSEAGNLNGLSPSCQLNATSLMEYQFDW